MFSLFKKKRQISNKDYEFLKAIVTSLPSKYFYLVNQVSKDFILDKKPNELGDKGTYVFTLNANLESKYSNKDLPPFFIIKDIGVWNIKRNSYELVELDILEGMLAGYLAKVDLSDLDFCKIDTSHIKEKHFKSEDKAALKEIIGNISDDLAQKIDIESTFKIEIPEGVFYTIKNLGDGNYLSMDMKGAVYSMIHDPYLIEKIFDNKTDFFETLNQK